MYTSIFTKYLHECLSQFGMEINLKVVLHSVLRKIVSYKINKWNIQNTPANTGAKKKQSYLFRINIVFSKLRHSLKMKINLKLLKWTKTQGKFVLHFFGISQKFSPFSCNIHCLNATTSLFLYPLKTFKPLIFWYFQERRKRPVLWSGLITNQLAITCSKLTIEALEQDVKYV